MEDVCPAGPFPIAGVGLETWVVRFDEGGRCASPATAAALLARLRELPGSPVILFSHGWNNDFADAVDLYRRFLAAFEAVLARHPLPGPAPLFVGVVWPSVWFPGDDGPSMAAVVDGPAVGREAAAREKVLDALRAVLPAATDWPRLRRLSEAGTLDADQALELAAMLRPALIALSEEGDADATAPEIVETLHEMRRHAGPPASVVDEDLDEVGTVGGTDPAAPGTAGGLGPLDPRWALRLATLYLMKDRAGTVGRGGVGAFVRDVLSVGTQLHVVGHSFGAKVVLSAVASAGLAVRSMSLLQPAVSHLCFADAVPGRVGAGGYRDVLDHVTGSVLSTFSANDVPLHDVYHHALLRRVDLGEPAPAAQGTSAGSPPSAYAALGGYGPRASREHLVDPIPDVGEALEGVGTERLIGLDGTRQMRIAGHGDVANRFTAWALRLQVASSGAGA